VAAVRKRQPAKLTKRFQRRCTRLKLQLIIKKSQFSTRCDELHCAIAKMSHFRNNHIGDPIRRQCKLERRKTINVRDILRILAPSFVLVIAASGHTTTSHRKSVHFTAPVGAHQKMNTTDVYEPPRSPGYNALTES